MFALQSLGALGRALRGVGPFAELGGPAMGVGVAGAVALAAGALVVGLARARVSRPRLLAALALLGGAVELLHAVLDLLASDHFAAWVAPLAHAVRFALPIAIAAALLGAPRSAVGWGLRAAVAAVFAGHGIECLLGHPRFVDFLLVIPPRVFGVGPSLEQARGLLTSIGLLDVGLGLALLVRPWRGVLGWMVFWGTLTASARLLYFGVEGWPEALVRITNGGVPWLLLLRGGPLGPPRRR